MPRQKKQIRSVYSDHYYDEGLEDLRSFMIPLYITRIYKVIDNNTGEETKLTPLSKQVYGFLCGIGYNYGYNSIYPNVSDIAGNLAANEKSIRNALKILESAGLVKIRKIRLRGRFDSNHYWVYRPNLIHGKTWINIDGDRLAGKMYKFDPSQFHKKKGVDKLIEGIDNNMAKDET